MFERLWSMVEHEWDVLKSAPVIFTIFALLAGAIGFEISNELNRHELGSARQDRDTYKDKLDELSTAGDSQGRSPSFSKTALGLQFYGDNRKPREIHQENVKSWYAFYSNSVVLKTVDARTKREDVLAEAPKNWFVVLVFDHPIRARQFRAEFSYPNAPPIAVVRYGDVSVGIIVSGDPAPGNLEVYATPP